MSIPAGKLTVPELLAMKRRGDRIVMVTAYDAPGARIADDSELRAVGIGRLSADQQTIKEDLGRPQSVGQ